MHRLMLIVLAVLGMAAALAVQWSYRDFPPVADDLDHLSGVASVETGEQSLADFTIEPHGPHWLPLWKTWYYWQWKVARLDAWKWHLVLSGFHIASALLLYILLRAYLSSPWSCTVGALLWAGSAIGSWDNPLNWIASSHFLMSTTFLLVAMIAVTRLGDSHVWCWVPLLFLSVSMTLLTMSTMCAAVAILPLQYWVTHGRLPLTRQGLMIFAAWLIPFAIVSMIQLYIIRALPRDTEVGVAPIGTSLLVAAQHYVVAIDNLRPFPLRLHAATQATTTGWLLTAIMLLAVLVTLRRSSVGLVTVFLGLTGAMTAVACLARGNMPAAEVVTWGRYHFLPTLFWCVAIAVLIDRLFNLNRRVAAAAGGILAVFIPLYMARQIYIAAHTPFEHADMMAGLRGRQEFLQYLSRFSVESGHVSKLPDTKVFEDLRLHWSQYAIVAFGNSLPNVEFVRPEQFGPEDRAWLQHAQTVYRLRGEPEESSKNER